ncbi:hypothetical protein BV25DRAFT_1842978 [Artomyces pyxidatus]|uniref:Uncharacterized protein n=1 Tax=Artomyces pyxidatus TaxID=48021 RepID=A0ACB8SFR7_9AGAM|nr:hypothetical protein BV25DRAFT_1842978 [Artomyces pyxidatus]
MIHLKTREGVAQVDRRGQLPHMRTASSKVSAKVKAPSGLPRNLYDKHWLAQVAPLTAFSGSWNQHSYSTNINVKTVVDVWYVDHSTIVLLSIYWTFYGARDQKESAKKSEDIWMVRKNAWLTITYLRSQRCGGENIIVTTQRKSANKPIGTAPGPGHRICMRHLRIRQKVPKIDIQRNVVKDKVDPHARCWLTHERSTLKLSLSAQDRNEECRHNLRLLPAGANIRLSSPLRILGSSSSFQPSRSNSFKLRSSLFVGALALDKGIRTRRDMLDATLLANLNLKDTRLPAASADLVHGASRCDLPTSILWHDGKRTSLQNLTSVLCLSWTAAVFCIFVRKILMHLPGSGWVPAAPSSRLFKPKTAYLTVRSAHC